MGYLSMSLVVQQAFSERGAVVKRPIVLVIISLTILLCQLSGPVFGAVIWQDEFNGPNLDTNIWTNEVGGHGWGNGELQYYTNRIDGAANHNAYIENGNLVIEARRENYGGKQFTSARLISMNNLTFKYGTIEARIKMADLANGLWPAFWMLGANFPDIGWPDCGELDIVEMGSAAAIAAGTVNRKVGATAHWENGGGYAGYGLSTYTAANAYLDYHLFKLTWTPTLITAYLDGTAYWWFDISGGAGSDLEEFHEHMFIILNMAVGGWNYVEITNPSLITALPTPGSTEKMYIDWIRISDNAWTELWNDGDGDFDNDGNADMVDFSILAKYWLETNCGPLGNCENADVDNDGDVDFDDLEVLISDWLLL